MNRLEVFGGPTLTAAVGPITGRAAQRHRLALLALLATTRRLYRSRDQLVAFLWPDADVERGRKLLSDSIYRINQALGGDAFAGTGEDVRLNRIEVASDVADFEAAMEAREWQRAVELYTGPFLDGFFLPGATEFDQWMENERSHYARSVAKAIESLAVEAHDQGRLAGAAEWWRRLAAHVPDDSRVAIELMRALEMAGNRAGALRHARDHSHVLRETLGVEPDRSVQELADQIARGTRPIVTTSAVRSVPAPAALPEPTRESDAAPTPTRESAEPQVSDLYMRARFEWHRRTEHCLKTSATMFEQVVEREPDHTRAWMGLADAYAVMAFHDHLPPRVAFPRAECAARQAIRLDPGAAGAYATLAYVDTYYHWNWHSAERGFQRALALEPSYSMGHLWYGSLLAALGRFEEAEGEMRRAAEIDPLSMVAHASIGWVLLVANETERAIRQLQAALQLDAGFSLANYWMGLALEQNGQTVEAIRVLRSVLERSNECGVVMASLARTHAVTGDAESARALLDDLLEREARGRYISSFDVAKVYHALGDVDAALTRFERAYTDRSHSIALLNVDPQLRSLASDSRFADFLARVNGHAKSGGAPPAVRRSGETAFRYL